MQQFIAQPRKALTRGRGEPGEVEPSTPFRRLMGKSFLETVMRALSFILAFAFVLAGPALSRSAKTDNLPGVGTFAYSGSPTAAATPSVMTIASR
jgi:hypothetical protein